FRPIRAAAPELTEIDGSLQFRTDPIWGGGWGDACCQADTDFARTGGRTPPHRVPGAATSRADGPGWPVGRLQRGQLVRRSAREPIHAGTAQHRRAAGEGGGGGGAAGGPRRRRRLSGAGGPPDRSGGLRSRGGRRRARSGPPTPTVGTAESPGRVRVRGGVRAGRRRVAR